MSNTVTPIKNRLNFVPTNSNSTPTNTPDSNLVSQNPCGMSQNNLPVMPVNNPSSNNVMGWIKNHFELVLQTLLAIGGSITAIMVAHHSNRLEPTAKRKSLPKTETKTEETKSLTDAELWEKLGNKPINVYNAQEIKSIESLIEYLKDEPNKKVEIEGPSGKKETTYSDLIKLFGAEIEVSKSKNSRSQKEYTDVLRARDNLGLSLTDKALRGIWSSVVEPILIQNKQEIGGLIKELETVRSQIQELIDKRMEEEKGLSGKRLNLAEQAVIQSLQKARESYNSWIKALKNTAYPSQNLLFGHDNREFVFDTFVKILLLKKKNIRSVKEALQVNTGTSLDRYTQILEEAGRTP